MRRKKRQRVRLTESIMGAGCGALACSESLPLHSHLPSNSSDLPSDAVKRPQFNAKAAEGTKGRAMVLKQVQARQTAVNMQPSWPDGAALDAFIAAPPAVLAPLASAAVSTETTATSVPRRATSGRELEGGIERAVFG